jgi:predicted nucleic acid-binding protein
VLSALLRRRRRGEAEERLAEGVTMLLESDVPVVLPGIVFQEILSGIAEPEQARRVRRAIQEGFPVLLATERDHIAAAELVNAAARRGLAVSTPDALIAAQTIARDALLLTTDTDFARLAELSKLRLLGW